MHIVLRSAWASLAAMSLVPQLASAQPAPTSSRFSGTWRFVPAASHFTSGPALRSETRVYRITGAKVSLVATGVDGAGKPTRTSYTAAYDGNYYPLAGTPAADNIALRQTNARTVEATVRKGLSIVGYASVTVAPDGKRMVMTRRVIRPQGAPAVDQLSYVKVR